MKLLPLLIFLSVLPAMAIGQSAPAKMLNIPEYAMTPDEVAAGIDGRMAVSISVDKDGNVDRAEILAGPAWPCGKNPKNELSKVRESVLETVKRAKFLPAIKDGKPQGSELLFNFAIGEEFELLKKKRQAEADKAAGIDHIVQSGVINGKAISLPKPAYPGGGVRGAVTVQVLIDESGNVIRAGAITGPQIAQKPAREAACDAKFAPTLLSGQPVKVSGVITYAFMPNR